MNFEIDFVESYDRESIIRELQRIAAALGKTTLSYNDIEVHGRVSGPVVALRFGTLRNALQASGLQLGRFARLTDEELCSIIREMWTQTYEKYGRSPIRQDLREFGFPVSALTIVRRFGGWKKALLAAAESPALESPTGDAGPDATPSEPRPLSLRFAPPPPSAAASKTRKSLPVRKRFLVLKRDRYKCCLCNRSGLELEVDHKVPVAQGGTDALDNLQTLCIDCNRGKRDSSE